MGQKITFENAQQPGMLTFSLEFFISHQSVELLSASQPTVRVANANIAKNTDSMESLMRNIYEIIHICTAVVDESEE